LGIGALGLTQIHKMHEEFEKLNKEVEKLLHSGGDANFNTLSALETHLTKTADALERLREEQDKLDGGQGKWAALKQWGKDLFTAAGAFDATSLADVQRMRRDQLSGGLDGKLDADQRAIAEKRRRKKGDKFSAFDPNNNDDFIEAATPGPKQNGYLAAEIAEELKNGLLDLIHTIISKAEEKTKLSLSDLAGGPGYDKQNSASLQAIYNAQQAREVQRLEAQAKDQMLNQNDFAGAQDSLSRAENIRNGISSLKDSEKTHEFMDALDASQRLKNIETNTGKRLVNR
jgi:hypothetical protein